MMKQEKKKKKVLRVEIMEFLLPQCNQTFPLATQNEEQSVLYVKDAQINK